MFPVIAFPMCRHNLKIIIVTVCFTQQKAKIINVCKYETFTNLKCFSTQMEIPNLLTN